MRPKSHFSSHPPLPTAGLRPAYGQPTAAIHIAEKALLFQVGVLWLLLLDNDKGGNPGTVTTLATAGYMPVGCGLQLQSIEEVRVTARLTQLLHAVSFVRESSLSLIPPICYSDA
jgi:hypothetical protein